jgi:hypothetical protein
VSIRLKTSLGNRCSSRKVVFEYTILYQDGIGSSDPFVIVGIRADTFLAVELLEVRVVANGDRNFKDLFALLSLKGLPLAIR